MRIIKYGVVLDDDNRNVLVKESSSNYPALQRNILDPEAVRDLAVQVFGADRKAEEFVWMIATNSHFYPIGVFEVSHGSDRASMLNPREVFTRLFLCGASKFFLIHNHPSGDIAPSMDDLDATKRIAKGSQILGVEFMDHVIVGPDATYYSLRENATYLFFEKENEKS